MRLAALATALLTSACFPRPDCNQAPPREPRAIVTRPPADIGCSDGEREGFTDLARWPDIAGCSGGFTVPGLVAANPGTACGLATFDTLTPSCERKAGDDGA